MFFDAIRQDEVLTVTPAGRLDAVSATELETFLAAQDSPHRWVSLILDMRETVYLSSAGMRVLNLASRKTHERGGLFALFGLQPYCREVLRTVGMDKALRCFDSRAEAYEFCGLQVEPTGSEGGDIELETTSGTFDFSIIGNEPVSLVVGGDILDILHARLELPLVHGRRLDQLKYSLGFGAMGNVVADYMPLIGHMLTFDHGVFCTPADGRGCPDYLIPATGCDNSEMTVQAAFNLALDGDFNEMAVYHSTSPTGTELESVWHDLLHLATQRRPDDKGIIWISMLAETGSTYVNSLKRAPLLEAAPTNGKMINHSSNREEWLDMDMMPCCRDAAILLSGVGADLQRDLSDYNEAFLSRIFPMTPTELSGRRTLMRNHAAIFSPGIITWQADQFEAASRKLMNEGQLQRVGELQERSMIKHALIGIGYISNLEMPRQLDSLYARRLDYQLNRNLNLLKTYKALDENK